MSDNDIPVTIDAGQYWLEIDCPQCGGTEHVLIDLSGRLTVDDDAAYLKPRLKAKAADHICHQLTFTEAAADSDQPALTDAEDGAE